ncbi:uncharacterized protein LOC34617312, partial [Cyclospora cayetanensis]|uniref:dual-specificity kinase n=1 Tax=Cyclospora cayetanensis TaxID=88456 RepID=A0A6P6RXQ2_9EIME
QQQLLELRQQSPSKHAFSLRTKPRLVAVAAAALARPFQRRQAPPSGDQQQVLEQPQRAEDTVNTAGKSWGQSDALDPKQQLQLCTNPPRKMKSLESTLGRLLGRWGERPPLVGPSAFPRSSSTKFCRSSGPISCVLDHSPEVGLSHRCLSSSYTSQWMQEQSQQCESEHVLEQQARMCSCESLPSAVSTQDNSHQLMQQVPDCSLQELQQQRSRGGPFDGNAATSETHGKVQRQQSSLASAEGSGGELAEEFYVDPYFENSSTRAPVGSSSSNNSSSNSCMTTNLFESTLKAEDSDNGELTTSREALVTDFVATPNHIAPTTAAISKAISAALPDGSRVPLPVAPPPKRRDAMHKRTDEEVSHLICEPVVQHRKLQEPDHMVNLSFREAACDGTIKTIARARKPSGIVLPGATAATTAGVTQTAVLTSHFPGVLDSTNHKHVQGSATALTAPQDIRTPTKAVLFTESWATPRKENASPGSVAAQLLNSEAHEEHDPRAGVASSGEGTSAAYNEAHAVSLSRTAAAVPPVPPAAFSDEVQELCSSSKPLSPITVLQHFAWQLTEWERKEVLEYPQVWYWGSQREKPAGTEDACLYGGPFASAAAGVSHGKHSGNAAVRRSEGPSESRESVLRTAPSAFSNSFSSKLYSANMTRSNRQLMNATSGSACSYFCDSRGEYLVSLQDHICYRFQLLQPLGTGSFGSVFRALDHRTGEEVALKIIRNKCSFHLQGREEVKALRLLLTLDKGDKANVVHLKETFLFRGHLVLSFELLGHNLYAFLRRNKFRGFSTLAVRSIAIQLLHALRLLKKARIVHCDVKPENIALLNGRKSTVKLIDFGSSFKDGRQQPNAYIQSRYYRSPEVLLGLPYGHAIDIWSLGCVLAELHTGIPLFPGEDEADQLAKIASLLGFPPADLIMRSPRSGLFFDGDSEDTFCFFNSGHNRSPTEASSSANSLTAKSLEEAVAPADHSFVDFLKGCLCWDATDRMTPEEALQHPWLQEFYYLRHRRLLLLTGAQNQFQVLTSHVATVASACSRTVLFCVACE